MNNLYFGPMSAFAGLLCPLFVIAMIAIIIFSIIRAAGRAGSAGSGAGQAPLPNVTTQLGEDGFWIGPCPCDPGALIYYDYWTSGARDSGRVPYQPDKDGRQFVYTGRKPERVSIRRIVQQVDDTTTDIVPPIASAATSIWASAPSDEPDQPSSPPPSTSFPSAY